HAGPRRVPRGNARLGTVDGRGRRRQDTPDLAPPAIRPSRAMRTVEPGSPAAVRQDGILHGGNPLRPEPRGGEMSLSLRQPLEAGARAAVVTSLGALAGLGLSARAPSWPD